MLKRSFPLVFYFLFCPARTAATERCIVVTCGAVVPFDFALFSVGSILGIVGNRSAITDNPKNRAKVHGGQQEENWQEAKPHTRCNVRLPRREAKKNK